MSNISSLGCVNFDNFQYFESSSTICSGASTFFAVVLLKILRKPENAVTPCFGNADSAVPTRGWFLGVDGFAAGDRPGYSFVAVDAGGVNTASFDLPGGVTDYGKHVLLGGYFKVGDPLSLMINGHEVATAALLGGAMVPGTGNLELGFLSGVAAGNDEIWRVVGAAYTDINLDASLNAAILRSTYAHVYRQSVELGDLSPTYTTGGSDTIVNFPYYYSAKRSFSRVAAFPGANPSYAQITPSVSPKYATTFTNYGTQSGGDLTPSTADSLPLACFVDQPNWL